MLRNLLTAGAIFCSLALAAGEEQPRDSGAVAVVVHKSCATDNLALADLRKMLLGEVRNWPDSRRIVLIGQPDENPLQRRMLRLLLRTDPSGYKKELLAQQFQGRELPMIKILNADDNAIKFVWNLPGAIALVNAESAAVNSARVKILRIDGKTPGEPGYLLQ